MSILPATSPITVMWMVTSSWASGASMVYQYNIVVKNTGTNTYNQIYVRSTNTKVTKSWSVTPKDSTTPYILLFPSYLQSLGPQQQYNFGCTTIGKTTFVVDSSVIQSASTPVVTPPVTPPVTPTSTIIPTITTGTKDKFGVNMLYKSTTDSVHSREWYSQWDKGSLRTFTFGPAGPTDPELVFRGSGKYTIYGTSDPNRSGMMAITGSTPRIYIRNSNVEGDVLPSSVKKWGNVEITFYANTTNPGSSVGYAGIEAVARTNHMPDSALCGTRGYGGKINFDGRAQFEKECCHGHGNKQAATVYPFPNKGKMPNNTWIGYKFIVRGCENNTKCKLELYMDMTDGLNGGDWKLLTEFIDTDGWSSDTPSCCDAHKGKVLLPPFQQSNYTVYLRSDDLGEQLYKKLSVREIDPLP